MKCCFVTGGTGFIGSHLVACLLGLGLEVRCLVRHPRRLRWLEGMPCTVVEGDLEEGEALRRGMEGVDAVFHLAGLTAARTREEYFRVNAEGARRCGEAALDAGMGGPFLFVSSQAVSGPGSPDAPVREGDVPAPLTDYGHSKLEGERQLAALGGLRLVVARPSAVYGPRDRELLPLFRLAGRGVYPLFSPSSCISIIHVEDLARGLVQVVEGGREGATYHLANREPVALRELPALLSSALSRPVRPMRVPRLLLRGAALASELGGRARGRVPVFNRQKLAEINAPGWVCDTTRAREQLGFVPRIGLKEGLAATARWYGEQGWL